MRLTIVQYKNIIVAALASAEKAFIEYATNFGEGASNENAL
jgi:hypothetical protein